MKTYTHHIVGLLAAAAFITGCGGGGGAGTPTGTPSTTGTTNTPSETSSVVSIYSAPLSATPLVAPVLSGDVATDAIAWMNYRRAQIGLSPMVRNTLLNTAALAHANYLALNTYEEGHSETQGRPGFTGSTVSQRTLFAGYAGVFVGENINAARFKYGPIQTDGLIDAPYHLGSAKFSSPFNQFL